MVAGTTVLHDSTHPTINVDFAPSRQNTGRRSPRYGSQCFIKNGTGNNHRYTESARPLYERRQERIARKQGVSMRIQHALCTVLAYVLLQFCTMHGCGGHHCVSQRLQTKKVRKPTQRPALRVGTKFYRTPSIRRVRASSYTLKLRVHRISLPRSIVGSPAQIMVESVRTRKRRASAKNVTMRH